MATLTSDSNSSTLHARTRLIETLNEDTAMYNAVHQLSSSMLQLERNDQSLSLEQLYCNTPLPSVKARYKRFLKYKKSEWGRVREAKQKIASWGKGDAYAAVSDIFPRMSGNWLMT